MISLRGGRFRILGPLGEGAQGSTFDGVDAREGRPVAIKRFDVRGASAWKDVELAEREARVLQSLSHPKLPRYVDRFEEDGALYLVMEKIEGESLAAIRKRGGALGERDVERLLKDAADVLAYLHGRSPPVFHRDLKPGNVIRRPDGSYAFVDFGAVRDKLRPEGGSTVVGTFGYMAPEQFQGRALPGSDVYAVGATAVAMLTGREPEQLPHKGLALDVRGALAGRAGDRMIAVLQKMLEPDPDRRAASIAPLLAQLAGRAERDARRAPQGARPPWAPESRERFEEQVQYWASRYERKRAR
jgi:serine/threonine protein kinase